jgi:putative endonuclease
MLYIGCTNDLKKRLALHNAGKVASTKNRQPLELVYYEAYTNSADGFSREKYLKTGWGRTYIKKVAANYFINKNLGR